jgi:prepilin-type N-terminal cleavage/methylation domain-containing protein
MDRQRGFSLAEVMVAFLVLTIVITVSFAAFLQRNKRLEQAAEIVLAYQALSNEAEYQRRVPFHSLGANTAFLSDTTILKPLAPFGTAIRVDETRPGVRSVTMTIRWNEGKREARLALVRADTGGTNLW